MATLRDRILAEPNGPRMLDTYLLNRHVVAITCDPTDADTCVVGIGHDDSSQHVCLKKVELEDEIPEGARILMITKATWEKSLEENILKGQLEDFKRQQD